jgi:hypothetical protein
MGLDLFIADCQYTAESILYFMAKKSPVLYTIVINQENTKKPRIVVLFCVLISENDFQVEVDIFGSGF